MSGLTRRALMASAMAALPVSALAQGGHGMIYRDPKVPLETRVRDLLGRMTLDEKVAQMRCL